LILSIFQLLYTSTARPGLAKAELEAILEAAQRNNAKRSLTGFLIFDGHHFIQLLEGTEHDVQNTYKKIAGDGRHTSVEPLLQDMKPTRSLSNWAMAYTQIDGDGTRLSGGSMDTSSALELASMLKQNATPMRLIISEFLSSAFSKDR
jgi:hypothetical protein